MRILITGVSGFLGSQLADYLFYRNYSVIGTVSSNRSLCSSKIKVYTVSLENNDNLFYSINDEFDVLIHCASAHPSITTNNEQIIIKNINSVKNLIKFSTKSKIKKIIFCSSTAVYGKVDDGIIKYNSKFKQVSLYGLSKLICEELFLEWGKNFNKQVYNIRLPAIVGKGCHETFIIKLINAFKYNKKIEIGNKNDLFNNIVDINDLIKFIFNIISKEYSSNTLVLGSRNPVNIKSIINTIKQFYPNNNNFILNNTDIKSFYINYDQAKKIGYKPSNTINVINNYLQTL